MGFESFPQPQAASPERKDLVRKYVESETQRVNDATQRRLGSKTLERAHLEREHIAHNNLDIDFLGVAHEPETLLKYRAEIEKAIEQADFVIVESVLNVGREEALSTAKLSEQRAGKTANDIFFGEIENAARKYGKKIISMDAFTSAKNLSESGRTANEAHLNESDRLKDAHCKVAAVGVAVAGAAAWIQQGSEKTTRRGFLKGAAYAVGGVAGIDGVLNGTDIGYSTKLRVPLHGGQDYRDVILAEGVDFLSQKFSRKMKIAMIYGSTHSTGLRSYLENPALRSEKRKNYWNFDRVDSPEIRGYAFHEGNEQEKSEWKEIFRVKI